MRKYSTLTILLAVTASAFAQPEPEVIRPRYGIAAIPDAYPQTTAKDALGSATKAVEKGKFEYLTAHLLDPKFVDDRVNERAAFLEVVVDFDLRAERASQRLNPLAIASESRIPDDPKFFDVAVKAEARNRAFKLVVKDVRDTLAEHPDTLNDFKKFLRVGQFLEAGDAASASVREFKDRQLFFRRTDSRWFVENRQLPEAVEKK